MTDKTTFLLAERGRLSWTEHGRTETGTVSRHPVESSELTAPVRIDWEPSYSDTPARDIWRRPNLDLTLPDYNVRDLLEGCIGCEGTTDGHPWRGEDVKGTASVGMGVYIEIAEWAGAKVTRIDP